MTIRKPPAVAQPNPDPPTPPPRRRSPRTQKQEPESTTLWAATGRELTLTKFVTLMAAVLVPAVLWAHKQDEDGSLLKYQVAEIRRHSEATDIAQAQQSTLLATLVSGQVSGREKIDNLTLEMREYARGQQATQDSIRTLTTVVESRRGK